MIKIFPVKRSDYGSSTWALHRVLRDNQGSIVTVASATGSVRQSMAYDAWGAPRNPSTGEAYAPDAQPELLLGRGYTGHEHLPEFGLVNMNARLYDPALGRFLNPDPEVQLPDNTQSYNRYSYCLNNPLRYADPTGMFNQLPPQYKQRHLDPDTYDGEMLYELVVTGYRTAYWKGCGVFAPNAPYVDNYAFVLSNRYGQPQSPLPYGYGTTMGGGYTYGDINYSSRDKISIFINSVTVLPQTIINKWNAVVKKELPEGEKFSIASYGKLYGKDVAIVAKSIKILSSSLLISDIAVTLGYITDDINEGKKASATMRGVVMGTTILIGFIPVVGPGISLGVGICDALYGQYLYDFIENRYGQILHSDSVQ